MNVATRMSADELRELYRELILDHAKQPRHFGKLNKATHSAQGINPLCGDKLSLYLQIDAAGRISDAAFEGTGCAISVASASLLTDAVIGLDTADVLQMFRGVTARLTGNQDDHGDGVVPEKLRSLEGVREFPARVKCATLAWHALHNAIEQQDHQASTE